MLCNCAGTAARWDGSMMAVSALLLHESQMLLFRGSMRDWRICGGVNAGLDVGSPASSMDAAIGMIIAVS